MNREKPIRIPKKPQSWRSNAPQSNITAELKAQNTSAILHSFGPHGTEAATFSLEHAYPSVSVIVSNYNGGELLKRSLESLLKQDYPSLEVIVVDAGSTDRSPDTIMKEFPEVFLIPKEARIGIGEAINIGITHAKGEVIVFDFLRDSSHNLFKKHELSLAR